MQLHYGPVGNGALVVSLFQHDQTDHRLKTSTHH